MTLLRACIIWVFYSVACAILPMRLQNIPAVILLIAAPIMTVWIGIQLNVWVSIVAVFAFGSMFRNPLRNLWAKLRGQNLKLPPELSG